MTRFFDRPQRGRWIAWACNLYTVRRDHCHRRPADMRSAVRLYMRDGLLRACINWVVCTMKTFVVCLTLLLLLLLCVHARQNIVNPPERTCWNVSPVWCSCGWLTCYLIIFFAVHTAKICDEPSSFSISSPMHIKTIDFVSKRNYIVQYYR